MYDAEFFRFLYNVVYLNEWMAALFVLVVALAAGKDSGTSVPLREFIEMQMLNFERLLREGFERQGKQLDDLEKEQEKKTNSLAVVQKEHGKRIGKLESHMGNVNKVGAVILTVLTGLVIAILIGLVKGCLALP